MQNQPPSLEPCASQPSPSLHPSFPPVLRLSPPPAICHHVVGKSHISAATILPFSTGAGGGGGGGVLSSLSLSLCPGDFFVF